MSHNDLDRTEDGKLKSLHDNLRAEAAYKNYDINIVGGLLKFTPKSVPAIILLELEQETIVLREETIEYEEIVRYGEVCIYKHRNEKLSNNFKGRRVSFKWVIGFLEANITEATNLTKKYKDNPPVKSKLGYDTNPSYYKNKGEGFSSL